MQRLFLVPRWAGSVNGDFYEQLGDVAKRHGFQLRQLMPPKGLNPPDQDDTFAFLDRELSDLVDGDVLMGHSVGCQLILRFLARPECAVKARPRLLCVAGWMFIDKSWPSIEPFLQTDQVDWEAATRRLSSIALFVSDNDQFTSDYKANVQAWERRFGASFVLSTVVPGGKHFNNKTEDALCEHIGRALARPASLWEPLLFPCGARLAHLVTLSPLTNCQSHDDGTLAEEELVWLTMRARGGFSLTATTATFVHGSGKAFPGQLGAASDAHIAGLRRLAEGIRAHGSLSVLQLHHGGVKADHTIDGVPRVAAIAEHGARALSTAEVRDMVEWFVRGAERAKEAGFDGVEVHGAHGYILTSFLSTSNQRDDEYGGSLENRSRSLFQIVEGIRRRCGPGFLLGVRLSVERYGLSTSEMVAVSQRLCDGGLTDFLDLSLWDVFKQPEDHELAWRSLAGHFLGQLDRKQVKIGVVGKIVGGQAARSALELGCDFVIVGRAAVVHHDFPKRVREDPDFVRQLPATDEGLRREGVSDKFLTYLHKNFNESLFAAPSK